MMKGQIHEELKQLDNAREAYKLGVGRSDEGLKLETSASNCTMANLHYKLS